jgi:Holliday junction resolvase RusA-like endonuclease
MVIPDWRPATLNELMSNRFRAARLKKADRKIIAGYARLAGTPKATGKRRVSVEVTRSGRMKEIDPDGIWKSLNDALVHAGLLVDDNSRLCELGTFTQPKGDRKSTRIILEDLS